jgi:DNA-binding CsgD family transcriptional regulator
MKAGTTNGFTSRLREADAANGSRLHARSQERAAWDIGHDRLQDLRETGLPAVGDVARGSHFCIFYETKQDLLEILAAYFKAGLQQNEFCLWIVASYEFVTVRTAKEALAKVFPGLNDLLRKGNIEILTHKQLFGIRNRLDPSTAIARVQEKAADALARGLSGMRWNGSSAWVRVNLKTRRFREFERDVDVLLSGHPIIAACTFPIALSSVEVILDAARTHQFAVTVQKGVWKRVEVADIDAAIREANPNLEQLSFRQREILQHIAEGLNTKQIAALLAISIKTVEAHRLRLMRRLKIDNVPALVRFAIRTGLVSAAA